ncbi:hypothetical protein OVA14_03080 [Agrococcus sp. SL85]|uniref:hypothetical protein n=1 Tax=Agrococcus sp. SL85 TaxID=2995141 RepID=UPI00226C73D6|nr:hypothetical protein [Agrococcus sp. SL85]WAC66774.1 hypothetical protein OVA14_03080 [Agrococcus sp. SL85]
MPPAPSVVLVATCEAPSPSASTVRRPTSAEARLVTEVARWPSAEQASCVRACTVLSIVLVLSWSTPAAFTPRASSESTLGEVLSGGADCWLLSTVTGRPTTGAAMLLPRALAAVEPNAASAWPTLAPARFSAAALTPMFRMSAPAALEMPPGCTAAAACGGAGRATMPAATTRLAVTSAARRDRRMRTPA